MSKDMNIKKIELDALDKANKEGQRKKIKGVIPVLAVLIVIAGAVGGMKLLFADETHETRFVINNMTCGGCVGKVERACTIPGVLETNVNLITQTATIKFSNKQTDPEKIKMAINRAGFPSLIEGTVTKTGEGLNQPVIALINGQPVFENDLKVPYWSTRDISDQPQADLFYDLVAWQVFLDAATNENIFTHPFMVLQEAEKYRQKEKLTRDDVIKQFGGPYGSFEKYHQIAGCRKSVFTLVNKITTKSADEKEKMSLISKWTADRFKALEVTVYDQKLKEALQAETGETSWDRIWPRMISKKTGMYQSIQESFL